MNDATLSRRLLELERLLVGENQLKGERDALSNAVHVLEQENAELLKVRRTTEQAHLDVRRDAKLWRAEAERNKALVRELQDDLEVKRGLIETLEERCEEGR